MTTRGLSPGQEIHLDKMRKIEGALSARAARSGLCPNCGQPVLSGLDADLAAGMVTVDPDPVDRAGEAQANADARWTYWLIRSSSRRNSLWELHWRGPEAVRAGGPRRFPVHAEHRCAA